MGGSPPFPPKRLYAMVRAMTETTSEAKPTYEPPEIKALGAVSDLTQGTGLNPLGGHHHNHHHGGVFPPYPTTTTTTPGSPFNNLS